MVNYTFVELLSHSCAFTNNTWLIVHRLAQLCLSSQAHVFQHAGRGRHLAYTNLWKFHFQIGSAAIGPCPIFAMQWIEKVAGLASAQNVIRIIPLILIFALAEPAVKPIHL